MSLSSILQSIQRKGQLQQPVANNVSTSVRNSANKGGIPLLANRPIDPVVARLKEKRRLEKEQKEKEAREKKGLPPKSSKPAARQSNAGPKNSSAKPAGRPNGRATSKTPTPPPPPPSNGKPHKKMNFNELMKKASQIDQSKLSLSIRQKAKTPEAKPREKPAPLSRSGLGQRNRRPDERSRERPDSNRRSHPSITRPTPSPPVGKPSAARAPLPIRGPSSQLQQKLKKPSQGANQPSRASSSRRYEEYDSEDDDVASFIASDEDEELSRSTDYDRDEIWAIFNKGKKRSYYDQYEDYDSADDMEATGAEILEEEMRSKRRAELEDRKEMEEEKRRADLKRARKGPR